MFSSIVLALALSGSNVAFAATTSYAPKPTFTTIQPALTSILATQATTVPLSPVSNVKGVAFDRIVQIWLENTVTSLRVVRSGQMLTFGRRTTQRLQQTQICNGWQVKVFS